MQRDCGFCPGDRRGSVDAEVDRMPGMDAQPKEEISLEDLMKGDISPFVPGGYNVVIDQEEVTTTGFVTYGGGYIDEWGGGAGEQEGGILKEVIDPVGVLPPKPLPTPPEKQTPPGKRGLPDLPNGPTDTKPVTTLPPNPFKPVPPKLGPPGNPGGGVGTYPVTPTNPYPPKPTTPSKPTAKPMPKLPQEQKPTAPTRGNKGQIEFGPNADKEVLSQKTIDALSQIMAESGNSKMLITSTARSPYDQARVMLDNIKKKGAEYNIKLYKSPGKKVVRYAVQLKNEGYSDKETIEKMKEMIEELGPQTVSSHSADPKKMNVVDIAPSSLTSLKAFIDAAIARGYRVLHPSSAPPDPAVHVEIPQ